MNEYTKQAEKFIKDVNAKVTIEYVEYGKHFDDDKEERNIYRITIKRNGKSFTFKFGDSINNTQNGEEPSVYDVLACVQKYDCGTFENFCSEFGYDTDSRKAEKTYKAVCREFKGINRVFGDVLEQLQEIA